MTELGAKFCTAGGFLPVRLLRTSLLLALAALITLLLRRRSAALRSGICSITFVTLLLLPVLSALLPSWNAMPPADSESSDYSSPYRTADPAGATVNSLRLAASQDH